MELGETKGIRRQRKTAGNFYPYRIDRMGGNISWNKIFVL